VDECVYVAAQEMSRSTVSIQQKIYCVDTEQGGVVSI